MIVTLFNQTFTLISLEPHASFDILNLFKPTEMWMLTPKALGLPYSTLVIMIFQTIFVGVVV